MQRRAFVQSLGASAVLLGVGVPKRASAADVLKIGTLAPKSSPWGKVFSTWEKAVSEKSGGRLELQFFFSGQQGDESGMVAKIKSSQLHGAAVTGVGLSKIYKPILALQLPGLFTNWAKLDKARDVMRSEFEKGASDAGFSITGWGDVGLVRRMSKGFAVRSPDDMKGKKPLMWRDDPMQPVFFQTLGGVNPVPLNIPEVLPNLNTGAINIVSAPCLAAEQLQWATKLDTIIEDPSSIAIGALVFSSKALESLPADLRAIVVDTGKVAANALTARIRNEDSAAFGRIKGKMTSVKLTADEQSRWDALNKQVRQKLAQGTFSAELVAKLEGLAR